MDKVFIRDLLARGVIGINDWEREKPQDILINIEISTDLQYAGKNDDISRTVNYRTIAKKVLSHAEKAQRRTVEALAADFAEICLAEQGVAEVLIRVEKPGAVRFSKSVGVEIVRRNVP